MAARMTEATTKRANLMQLSLMVSMEFSTLYPSASLCLYLR